MSSSDRSASLKRQRREARLLVGDDEDEVDGEPEVYVNSDELLLGALAEALKLKEGERSHAREAVLAAEKAVLCGYG